MLPWACRQWHALVPPAALCFHKFREFICASTAPSTEGRGRCYSSVSPVETHGDRAPRLLFRDTLVQMLWIHKWWEVTETRGSCFELSGRPWTAEAEGGRRGQVSQATGEGDVCPWSQTVWWSHRRRCFCCLAVVTSNHMHLFLPACISLYKPLFF